MVYICIIF